MTNTCNYVVYGNPDDYIDIDDIENTKKGIRIDFIQGDSDFTQLKYNIPEKYRTPENQQLTIIPSGDCGIVAILDTLKMVEDPQIIKNINKNINYYNLNETTILDYVYEHKDNYYWPNTTTPIFYGTKTITENEIKETIKAAIKELKFDQSYETLVKTFGNYEGEKIPKGCIKLSKEDDFIRQIIQNYGFPGRRQDLHDLVIKKLGGGMQGGIKLLTQPAILNDLGLPAHIGRFGDIASKVENGYGVILNVNSELLKKEFAIPIITDHVITLLGVVKKNNIVIGYYYAGSGDRYPRYISSVDLFIATKGIDAFPIVTDQKIRKVTPIKGTFENGKFVQTCGSEIKNKIGKIVNTSFLEELGQFAITFQQDVPASLLLPPVLQQIATFYEISQIFLDPLVLDLDGDGIETIKLNDSNVYFDLDNDGFKEKSGWVSNKDDCILIVDENNNGLVDGVSELFGNTTINGFDELKLSDSNNDGKIDSQDANFTKIKIWQDLNENGISEAREFKLFVRKFAA